MITQKICFTLSFIIATIKVCNNDLIVTPPPGWLYLVITYVLCKKIFLYKQKVPSIKKVSLYL